MSFRFGADGTANSRVTRTGGAPDPQGAGGWTLCGWWYLSADRNDNSTLFRAHASSGSSTRINVATAADGVTPSIFTPGNTGGVAGVDAFTVGSWLWVAVVQSGTTATIYTCTAVGGTLHSASGGSSGGSAPDGYTIGGRSPTDNLEWFNGRGRYVRQWSGVQLTPTELAAERDSATAVKAGAYSNHPLATGTDLSDASGNSRTLTAGSVAGTTEADPPLGTSFTDAGTATMALGGAGAQSRSASATGTADVALSATGTASTQRGAAGTAAVALGAAGASAAQRAAAGAADAQLSASGSAARAATDTGSAGLILGAAGSSARSAAGAGSAAVSLGGAGTQLLTVTVAGIAELTLQATGTVDSGGGEDVGSAVLVLGASGAHTAVRAAAGSAVLMLDATGVGDAVSPVVDSGTAVLVLGVTGEVLAVRAAAGAAVLHLVATGVVSGEQRDITVHARLLPARSAARILPSRWLVKEVQ